MQTPSRVGRYSLLKRIGRGGMGQVHLGVLDAPSGIQSLAAVKLTLDGSEEQHRALLLEARLAALISHPGVVRLLDAGFEGEVAWFAMEYVRGPSLAELLERASGRLPPWVAARIVADVCSALHAVHEACDAQGKPLGIVHRDVSPQNILVSYEGFVKLVDLGIARSALHGTPTSIGTVKGKLGYLSPEQAGGAPVDRRGDVFALGVVLWEALAGKRLFQRATDGETLAAILRADVCPLREVASDAPESIVAIAHKALAVDPALRFRSALEMHRALETEIARMGTVVGAVEVAAALQRFPPERDVEPGSPSSEVSTPLRTQAKGALRVQKLSARLGIVAVVVAALAAAVGITRKEAGAVEPRPTGDPPERPSHREARLPAVSEQVRVDVRPLDASASLPSAKSPLSVVGAEHARAAQALLPSRSPSNPQSGTLNIVATPRWAAIRVDGQPKGSTPLVVRGLRPGTHVIEAFPLGAGRGEKRSVSVNADGTEAVEFVFQ